MAMESDPTQDDDESDEVAADGPTNPYTMLKARYERLQQIALRGQNFFDDIASQLERVQARYLALCKPELIMGSLVHSQQPGSWMPVAFKSRSNQTGGYIGSHGVHAMIELSL